MVEHPEKSVARAGLSRRDVLRLGLAGAGTLFVAACGGGGGGGSTTTAPSTTASTGATSAGSTAAAGGSTAISGTVSIWYDTGAAWSDLINMWEQGFGALYPDVELDWVTQDPEGIQTKLLTAFSSGKGPDVAFAHVSNLVTSELEYSAWEDLTPYIQDDSGLQASYNAIPLGIRDSFVLEDGKTWGSPSNAALVAFFVRESWLDQVGAEPPKSWQDIIDVSLKFKEADPAGGGRTIPYGPFGAPGYDGTLGQWQYWGLGDGWETPVIDAEGKPSFDTDDGKRVAQFYYDIVHEYQIVAPDIANWTFKEFYQAVEAGVVGMGRLGSWNVPAWQDKPIGSDFLAIELPPSTAAGSGFQYQSSNGIAISASAANKDAAIAWLTYFLSEPAQTAMFEQIGAGARFDLDWTQLLGGNPRLEFFYTEEHDWLGSLDTVATFLPVGNELGDRLNKMLADKGYTPDQVLAESQEAATKAYEETVG